MKDSKQSTSQNVETENKESLFSNESSKDVCKFVKKPRRGNIRKKDEDEEVNEDDTTVVTKQKTVVGKPIVSSTKDLKRKKEEFSYESTNSALPSGSGNQLATATLETETDRERDATAMRRKQLEEVVLNGDEAVKAYKGLSAYSDYLPHKEQSGLSKGTGIKTGPIRGNIYARAISRMDYQPDVCKDYKETGYCGYGDSCKFLHDRGDYKNSVELEKEWEAQQAAAKKLKMVQDAEKKDEDEDDDFPFACSICRNHFTNPVKSKCQHFFCEKCALKFQKCAICGQSTNGIYKPATAAERKKIEKAKERHDKIVAENGGDNSE